MKPVVLQNNRMIKARERLGYPNAARAAKGLGLAYKAYVELESLRCSPVRADGSWTKAALEIADALYSDPNDLWPEESRQIRKSEAFIEASYEQLRLLANGDAFKRLTDGDDSARVRSALAVLIGFEQAVITRRAEGETLEEVGKSLGVGVERARQLEAHAIQKLRSALLTPDGNIVVRIPKFQSTPREDVWGTSNGTTWHKILSEELRSTACGKVLRQLLKPSGDRNPDALCAECQLSDPR